MTLLANINVGSSPNDGTGDSLRTSFIKCNDNFQILDELAIEFTSGNLNANITSNGTSTFNIVNISGNVTSSANITANYFIGDGSTLTNVAASTANSATYSAQVTGNIQSNITTVGTLGNLTVAGTIIANAIESSVVGNTGTTLTGTISTSSQPNVTSIGTLQGLQMASGTAISNLFAIDYAIDTAFDITIANSNVYMWSNTQSFGAINISTDLNIVYVGDIISGVQKTYAIKNISGSSKNVNLPNDTNNKGSNVFAIANGATATITFFSYDDTSANVCATIIND